MITITLPDNSQRSYEQPTSVQAIAESIGAGLAKAALAGKVNGRLVDTSYVVTENATIQIITSKDPEGLEVIRHSTAHLLAHAAKQLFPSIQITIGPVIEDGFYYDFAFERSFTPDDLTKLEAKMHELANQKIPIVRHVIERDKAIDIFRGQGEHYKVQIIQDLPPEETLTFYEQGDFMDLCRGPHVPNTSHLKAFKLMKLAGAYWRGDSKNEMLQRVYGTAWADKKQLDDYLYRLEEAEKRDHRKSAKVMDLFHTQEEAPGMIFWHDQGWMIYQTIEQYIRATLRRHGYQEIKTPQLADHSLWERSGHIAMYREEMFITESENRSFAIKPMSCPLHVQVFNHALRSYRELPLRLAEFGSCHRNEPSGTLHGLMRVRNLVQDDGHIFCTEEQIQSEALQYIQLLLGVYKDFGFERVTARLSTRPDKRVGDDALWDKAESALKRALEQSGLEWKEKPGDGAFYGPKIDFPLQDCLDRVWQCGTLQLDYCLPERLGAHYIAEDGSRQVPVMLHRAVLGSLERFIGVLLEHYAGHLPFWLAPSQVIVINITDRQAPYVAEVTEKLKNSGVRANFDLRNEKIGFKIREHTLRRVPYFVVTGDREMEQGTIAVRKRDGTDLGVMTLAEFIKHLQAEPNPGTQVISINSSCERETK